MHPFVKKSLANTSWLMSEKVLVMAANLAVSVMLARSLGPDGFGSLSYLLAIISMVSPLAALGLNSIVTRELINNPERQNQIIATTVAMRLVGAIAGSAICILIALFGLGLNNLDSQWGLFILAIGNVFTCFSVLEFWFQAKVAARVVTRMRLAIVLVFSVFKLLAVIYSVDFIIVIALFAIETMITGIGFITIFKTEGNILKLKYANWTYGLSLLRQSFWLILSGIAAIIYLKVDQIMLEQLASSAEVGTYAVAARMSEVWYFFADAIVITIFPALLSLKKRGENLKYFNSLQKISDLLFSLAILLAFSVTVAARPAISLLFGDEYKESAVILQWHIWAAVFVFMRSLVSKWLIAEQLLKYSLVSHGIGAIINIIANYYLIPYWGGTGAAVATVLSYFTASYLAFWISSATRPIAIVMTKSILLPFSLGYRYWPINKSGFL
ncbi:flippase [Vibrio cyclitrophicus]